MPRQRRRKACFVLLLLLAGCSGPANRPRGPADVVQPILSSVPFLATIDIAHEFKIAGWAVWLWNSGPTELKGGALEIDATFTPSADSQQFLVGVYPIHMAFNDRREIAFMSEVDAALVKFFVSASGGQKLALGGFGAGEPANALGGEGLIMFSQAAGVMEVSHSIGAGPSVAAPAPLGQGSDLKVVYKLPADADLLNPPSHSDAEGDFLAGFVAGGFLRTKTSYGGETVGNVQGTVHYPDGKKRIRATHGSDAPDPVRCAPGLHCTSVVQDFEDLGVGCQPSGRGIASADAVSPPGTYVAPFLVGIPQDYCSIVGATSVTPHPCAEMETVPFHGCPRP